MKPPQLPHRISFQIPSKYCKKEHKPIISRSSTVTSAILLFCYSFTALIFFHFFLNQTTLAKSQKNKKHNFLSLSHQNQKPRWSFHTKIRTFTDPTVKNPYISNGYMKSWKGIVRINVIKVTLSYYKFFNLRKGSTARKEGVEREERLWGRIKETRYTGNLSFLWRDISKNINYTTSSCWDQRSFVE